VTTMKSLMWLLLVAVVFVPHVRGATWYVERDGTGDFTVIQDAVDAAVDGDVIMIGPGRYDEYEYFEGNPQLPVFVLVEKDLTFVGTGTGETIIGPEDAFQFDLTVDVLGFWLRGDQVEVSISDLTVEHMIRAGVYLDRGRLDLERCDIRECVFTGIFGLFASGGTIRDCSFRDNGIWGDTQCVALGFYQPGVGVLVENCTFVNNFGAAAGAWWPGCRDIEFRDCHFTHGIGGVMFVDGSGGSVIDCTFEDFMSFGVSLSSCGDVVIEDCTITQIGDSTISGIEVNYHADSLTMRRNVIVSDSYVLYMNVHRIDGGEIRDNHFLREGDDAWWIRTSTYYPLPEPHTIDLGNNYWGTTDTDLLDQWIYDGNDDEDVDVYIDYLPLADGPVRTESVTWGAVKSLYRGEGQ